MLSFNPKSNTFHFTCSDKFKYVWYDTGNNDQGKML